MPVLPTKWSTIWAAYINHMSRKDVMDFGMAMLVTLAIGGAVMYVSLYLYRTKVKGKPKLSIPRRQPPPAAAAGVEKKDGAKSGANGAGGDANALKDGRNPDGSLTAAAAAAAAGLSGTVRRIPRAAQAALVDRGQRLIGENNFQEGLVCFLALLYSASNPDASPEERVLPTHLTECLRGAAQCFRGLGQLEASVKFLQAERRVFEEMVVQAANPEGRKGPSLAPESILAPLLGKGPEDKLPKRCFTLDEVSEACAKLGFHDVALAYKVKSSALKSKISGKALDPESDEAAQLARAISEYKTRHEGGAAALAAAIPPAASCQPPQPSATNGDGRDDDDESPSQPPADAASSRAAAASSTAE